MEREERLGGGREEARDRRLDPELDRPLVDRGRGDLCPRGGHRPGGVRVLERLDRVHHVVGRDRLAVLPTASSRIVNVQVRPSRARRPGRRRGRARGCCRSEPDEAAEHQADEGPVRAVRAVTGVIDSGTPTTPSRYVTGGGSVGAALGSGVGAGAGAGSASTPPTSTRARTRAATTAPSRRVIGICGIIAPGNGRGADYPTKMNDTSANRMNSTSSRIVNCHRRRSTPRRLR